LLTQYYIKNGKKKIKKKLRHIPDSWIDISAGSQFKSLEGDERFGFSGKHLAYS
jgi:hypothetical protein